LVYLDPPFTANKSYLNASGNIAQDLETERLLTYDALCRKRYDSFITSSIMLEYPLLRDWLEGVKGPLIQESPWRFAFLSYLAPRVVHCHRVLKDNGVICLHCDPTVSGMLRTLLEFTFSSKNFITEVSWKRSSAHNDVKRRPSSVKDDLLFFSKTSAYTWNQFKVEFEDKWLKRYHRVDEHGRRWKDEQLMARHTSKVPSDRTAPFRGFSPPPGRGWYLPRKLREQYEAKTGVPLEGTTVQDQLELCDKAGLLFWGEPGEARRLQPYYRLYLDEEVGGVHLTNIWCDIHPVKGTSKEKVGFPTQKPIALLERIIAMFTNPGDRVLDPFFGSGTTAIAASNLYRKWIGIELNPEVGDIARKRIADVLGLSDSSGFNYPTDEETARKLAQEDPHAFEHWVVTRVMNSKWVGSRSSSRLTRNGDGGIDGILRLAGLPEGKSKSVAIQVKAGSASRDHIRLFSLAMSRVSIEMGLFIVFGDRVPRTLHIEAQEYGYISSGITNDPRRFNKIQVLDIRRFFHRDGTTFLGASFPGFVEPNETNPETEEWRERQEVANLMASLPNEGDDDA